MNDPIRHFLVAASVPLQSSHRSGTLEDAERLRTAHPGVGDSNIFTAASVGNGPAVRRWIEVDPASATTKGGPYDWDPLTYLCFSKYLRHDRSRSHGFVEAARALLDAGANANTGWFEASHQPEPAWESVLYGAAGIAQHVELTRLLLERGADPNDDETPYHVPESNDNSVLRVLLESGKLNVASLATLLVRKADWHDYDGMKLLLEHGANPNHLTHWNVTPLQQAVRRDNAVANIELMLDHGGDMSLNSAHDGKSATALAARRGRRDVLKLLARRGVPIELEGADGLIAACAMHDAAAVHAMAQEATDLVDEVLTEGGKLIAEFAGVGNSEGVGLLLALGVPITAELPEGDGYWEIAPHSTALHVAAWRLRHDTVRYLLEHGAPVDAHDGNGRTPLALAVRGCVDSFWTERRSTESVEALLQAGASTTGVMIPCGYAEVDQLLKQYGANATIGESSTDRPT